jgi:hypothetical protein
MAALLICETLKLVCSKPMHLKQSKIRILLRERQLRAHFELVIELVALEGRDVQ